MSLFPPEKRKKNRLVTATSSDSDKLAAWGNDYRARVRETTREFSRRWPGEISNLADGDELISGAWHVCRRRTREFKRDVNHAGGGQEEERAGRSIECDLAWVICTRWRFQGTATKTGLSWKRAEVNTISRRLRCVIRCETGSDAYIGACNLSRERETEGKTTRKGTQTSGERQRRRWLVEEGSCARIPEECENFPGDGRIVALLAISRDSKATFALREK